MSEVEVWLVRHGETTWNAVHKICGWFDAPLSPRGEAMARALRPRLQGHDFRGVWSSDLSRARETGRLAYGSPREDERLRELDFGPLEGLDWTTLCPKRQEAVRSFHEHCTEGGETISQLESRVFSFLDDLSPGRHLLFVHAGVIRAVLRPLQADQFVPPTALARISWTQRRLLALELPTP